MNGFFHEAFLDELAGAAGRDTFQRRRRLLADPQRHRDLLATVADLSGRWERDAFEAEDGSRRARGIAMASPFGSDAATIA